MRNSTERNKIPDLDGKLCMYPVCWGLNKMLTRSKRNVFAFFVDFLWPGCRYGIFMNRVDKDGDGEE